MRAVIYTRDFEPITIVHLEPWARAYLEQNGRVVLAVNPPFATEHAPDSVPRLRSWTVTINANPIRVFDARVLLLTTADDETALLLTSVFLPGQQRAMREHERKAFADGVQSAFNLLGKLSG